jgi:hypothetical protein
MLEPSDPLWRKLDAAFRDTDIPRALSELAETWSDEIAKSLFWDTLCHQGTCYGATYAVVPHLLKIAEPETHRDQRFEIAVFLGYVTLCALEPRGGHRARLETEALQGLPETLAGWDRKLDCYRNLVASFEDPNRPSSDYERTELLQHYRSVLAIEPVNAGDLEKIQSIKADFFSALPAIRSLCERALHENMQNKDAVRYLLSGIAAADRLLNMARLLNYGSEGRCRCSSCDWGYEYILFGERVAIYANEDVPPAAAMPGPSEGLSRVLRDFREQAPSRCDGYIMVAEDSEVCDARAVALLSLADRAPHPEPALLLRHFLGSFVCCKCGAQGPMQAI